MPATAVNIKQIEHVRPRISFDFFATTNKLGRLDAVEGNTQAKSEPERGQYYIFM